MSKKITKQNDDILKLAERLSEILTEIFSKITPKNSPKVYKLLQSENGEVVLSEMIIKKMVTYNISAGACIPHLEREL